VSAQAEAAPAEAAPAEAAPAEAVPAEAAAPTAAKSVEMTEADEREARGLFQLGSQAYAEARYERALEHFREAYRLSGRHALLYNIGLALANLRRDQEALDAFERYLAAVPNAENEEVVQVRIAMLRKSLEKKEETVAPTPEETARAGSAPPSDYSEGPTDDGAITGKWWFWAGIGGAVVAGVVVGVLVASGGGQTVEGPVLLNDMTRVREL